MAALELEPENECCICFGNLNNRSTVTGRCTHKFCLKCMLLHLNIKNDCPLCRGAVLPTNDYKVIFERNQKLAQKLTELKNRFTNFQVRAEDWRRQNTDLKRRFKKAAKVLFSENNFSSAAAAVAVCLGFTANELPGSRSRHRLVS